MEQAINIETKQTKPAILRNLFEPQPEKTPNTEKHNTAVKSLTHIGVALVLSNFSLEYMSGEDLLNYIKGSVLATAVVLASFTTELKIASRVEDTIKSANPLGFAKRINHLFCKGGEQHAA